MIFFGSQLAAGYLSLVHRTSLLGQTALFLLTVVIFTKPLVRLFPTIGIFKTLLAIRRQLGQASAFMVIAHVFSQITPDYSLMSLLSYAAASRPNNFIFWGFWAFILILPLLLTSNDFSTNLLKKNWFLLQKLVHPLYFFAMLHYGLQKRTPTLVFVLFVLIFLYLLRFLAGQNIQFGTKDQTPPL